MHHHTVFVSSQELCGKKRNKKPSICWTELMEVNKTISGETSTFHHRSTLMDQPQ